MNSRKLIAAGILAGGKRGTPAATRDCPNAEVLARLLSGGLAEGELATVMDHVSGCDYCGAVLRAATDEEAESGGAENAEWAAGVARKMSAAGRPQTRTTQRWLAAAAVLAIVIGSGWWVSRNGEGAEQLLAQAYTESRPFEFRMPGAGYGPVRQQRSGGGASALERPAALIRAEAQILEELRRRPDAAEMLLLRGRAELLEQQFDAAIESLTRAAEDRPGDAAALADLGSAYALRGDSQRQPADYARAIDSLRRSLQLEPRQPFAMFNLALVYERAAQLEAAIEAWRRFLATEASGGWADEARQRLAALEERVKKRDAARRTVSPDADAFLALARANPDAVNPEVFQDVAWRDWMPQAFKKGAELTALRALGEMFFGRFADPSLREAAAAAVSQAGLDELSSAVARNLAGSYDEGAVFARQAESVLAANRVARLRARLELSYARQRGSADECLAAIVPLRAELERTPYVWMREQASLQEAICHLRSGEVGAARSLGLKSAERLRGSHMEILMLRAQGLLDNLDRMTGNFVAMWGTALEGLARGWEVSAPAARMQQFDFDLADAAKRLGLAYAAPVFGLAAVREISTTGNTLIEAINRVYLASLLSAAGDTPGAVAELKAAEAEFQTLAPSPTVSNLLQDARLTRAEIDAAHTSGLLEELERLDTGWREASWSSRLRIKQRLGRVLAEAGNTRQAMEAYRSAIGLHQEELRSMRDPLERASAAEVASAAYKGLIEIQLAGKDARGALATWDLYRGVREGSGRTDGGVALVYVALPKAIATWVVRGDLVREGAVTATPEEVQRVARRFQRRCSMPAADLAGLREDAWRLHQWLMEPLQAEIKGARLLMIDADEWLAGIPFQALIGKDGRYLVEDFAIALGARGAAGAPVSGGNAVVASVPSPGGRDAARFPALPAASEEARIVAESLRDSALLSDAAVTKIALTKALPNAAVFHFAGHGWSNGGDGGLVLPATDRNSEPAYLTANELAHGDWRRCRLVVLSACLTGAGEDRGPVNPRSLVRAFLAGGARRVVASRWNADSAATAALVRHFYRSLQGGSTPAHALAEGDKALLRESAWSHPYYWAAFAVYGEP